MTPHLLAGAFLALGAAFLVLPAWHAISRLDDRVHERRRLRRAALREAARQEQDTHPVARSSWEPYRRARVAPRRGSWSVQR